MAILATKRTSSTLVRIVDAVPTPDGTLPAGLYQIVNGAIPAMLRDVAVPVDGPAPADVRMIDAGQFERDIERAQRLSEQPAAAPECTLEQVCDRLRFHRWTEADLERAERLHFPKPTAKRVSASRDGRATLTWAYNARDIEQIERWAEDIAALARTVRI
jgi:hypothetical protein